jgi:hypothetical protein
LAGQGKVELGDLAVGPAVPVSHHRDVDTSPRPQIPIESLDDPGSHGGRILRFHQDDGEVPYSRLPDPGKIRGDDRDPE